MHGANMKTVKLLFEFTFLQGYCDTSLCQCFPTFRWMVASSSSGWRSSIHGLLYPEGEDNTIFRNCLSIDTAWYPRWTDSSSTPLYVPQIFQESICLHGNLCLVYLSTGPNSDADEYNPRTRRVYVEEPFNIIFPCWAKYPDCSTYSHKDFICSWILELKKCEYYKLSMFYHSENMVNVCAVWNIIKLMHGMLFSHTYCASW